MIYLLDTSGLVQLLRDRKLQEAWYDAIDAEAIGTCYPQRTEFRYSARDAAEYDEITEMFTDLYPDTAVPKNADRWISAAQYQMARAGHHRSASAIDLIIGHRRPPRPHGPARRRRLPHHRQARTRPDRTQHLRHP